jgi:hypothetical protein
MRHIGSHSLGEFPVVVVRIDGLMARFGPDIALLDLLMELAQCERRRYFSKPCGARYTLKMAPCRWGRPAWQIRMTRPAFTICASGGNFAA